MTHVTLAGLVELGWNQQLEHSFTQYRELGLTPARVAVQHRGAFVLYAESRELRAEASGRLVHEGGLPAVGDWVAARERPGGEATIVARLPRRSAFVRKAAGAASQEHVLAANADTVFLVDSLAGELNLRRLERYLTTGWESGAQPVVVLTKSDLCADPARMLEVGRVTVGAPVHAVSSVTGEGYDELEPYVAPGRTVALLGPSGVGKSTLLNRLIGSERQRTGAVRELDGKGRHTTSHRELVLLPGRGLVIDTPGLRELQLWEAGEGVGVAFADIEQLASECRFRDCAHLHEPGCAVAAAVDDGTVPLDRLRSYRKLLRELEALEVRGDARAASERRRELRRDERGRRRTSFS